MANHRSAIKRHKQSLVRRVANRSTKARVQSLTRKVQEAIAAGDAEAAASSLHLASKALAKAASKNVYHTRTASRRTSRLARSVASLKS